jgi:hypothetical protein
MARFIGISGLAALVCFCSASAQAYGWGWFPYRTSYYAPFRVVYYYPAYVVPACPAIPVMPYAAPKSAPPSQTGEPPTDATKPKVTESRSHGVKYAAAKDNRCRVGFWNITGRDVTILVEGQSRSLARNQSLTLELARTFQWQLDGRQQAERIPDGQGTYEIVLRP